MTVEMILRVLQVLLYIVLGGLVIWFKQNAKLRDKAKELINEAEDMFLDSTKQGGKRFQWVVDKLMELMPAPIRLIIPRSMVEHIVQNIFDAMKDFAKKTLDAEVNRYTE